MTKVGRIWQYVSGDASRLAAIAFSVAFALQVLFRLSRPLSRPPDTSTEFLVGPVVVLGAIGVLILLYLVVRLWSSPSRWIAAMVGAVALLMASGALLGDEPNVLLFTIDLIPVALCAIAWWEPRVVEFETLSSAAGTSPAGLRAKRFAVASLVLGILWLYGVGSVLAIIFGNVARRRIAASEGSQGGSGMAMAGIVLGWIGVAGTVIVIINLALPGWP